MSKNIVLAALLFISLPAAFGQYGDAYHKPNEMAIQEAKWRASRPVSSGSPTTTTTKLNVTDPMTLEEYFALRRKNSARSVDPEQKEEEIKKSAPQGYYEQIAAKYGMDSEDVAGLKHWDMAKPFGISFIAAGLKEGEALFLSRMLYKVVSTNKGYEVVFVPNQNILNAGTAFSLFQKEVSTGTFEQLMDHVMDFRYAGLSALNALDKIEQRFPEKRKVILMARSFPVVFARKSLLYREYSDKEQAQLLNYLKAIYAEMPQMVLAEDKFVGLAVGYNNTPAFHPLFEEALKQKDYKKAREIAMMTLLSDSTNAVDFVTTFGNKLKNHKYAKFKAPKEPIFTVDDVVAIHNHIKDVPKYHPRHLALFFYKLAADQQKIVLQKFDLSEKEFKEVVDYATSF